MAIGLVLILITPAANTAIRTDPSGQVVISSSNALLNRLHVYDVGVALFQAGLTITIFQVLLNQIADDRFVEQVRDTLSEQETTIQRAVAESMSVGAHLELLKLAPAELDRVIENAARLRTGSAELGSVISRKLRTGVFESEEIWRNLVVRADIIALERSGSNGKAHDYFDVYFQFGYHTTNVKRTRFAIKVARWQDEYDKLLRARDFGAVWRLPSTAEYDDDWANGFSLGSLTFGGQVVPFQLNEAEREYVAHIPADEFEGRPDVFVQYSFNAKILADGNLLSFEVPKPTFAATYSIGVAVEDIERIRALDYFGSTRPASIEYAPSLQSTRVIGISVDDWILPKAGVVVVWKRRVPPAMPTSAGRD